MSQFLRLSVFVLLLQLVSGASALQLGSADCREFDYTETTSGVPVQYTDAVLWQVQKPGGLPSYVFGTIHVSDPRVLDLPDSVLQAFNKSEQFIMEALPEPEQLLLMGQLMFYADGTTLEQYLDRVLLKKTAAILQQYNLPEEVVLSMKPWAAFLTMNYPPADIGLPLDLVLLSMAEERSIRVHGLERLDEQVTALSHLPMEDQLQLLLDTVCNYDAVAEGFDTMIELYLDRDLQGLFKISNQNSLTHEPLYQNLIKRLLTDRNYLMVERMQKILDEGNVFVAIGAMHLSGKEGVLSLLKQQGFQITAID